MSPERQRGKHIDRENKSKMAIELGKLTTLNRIFSIILQRYVFFAASFLVVSVLSFSYLSYFCIPCSFCALAM